MNSEPPQAGFSTVLTALRTACGQADRGTARALSARPKIRSKWLRIHANRSRQRSNACFACITRVFTVPFGMPSSSDISP